MQNNDLSGNSDNRGWTFVAHALVVPVLLVVFGVIWPMLNPPSGPQTTAIFPAEYQALKETWNEIYVTQPAALAATQLMGQSVPAY